MSAAKKTTAMPIKPIYSGPRPEINREAYQANCRYLDNLMNTFSLHFYSPQEGADQRIILLYQDALQVREQCEAVYSKARELREQLEKEAGDGTTIEDAREILDLLPPHRITSGPTQEGYYNRCRFKLAFKPEILPAIARYHDIAEYALKKVIDISLLGSIWLQCRKCDLTFCKVTDDDNCRQCNLPMVQVPDQHEVARLENKALQDRLLPLKECGFQAWLSIEKVSKINILATLVVSGR